MITLWRSEDGLHEQKQLDAVLKDSMSPMMCRNTAHLVRGTRTHHECDLHEEHDLLQHSVHSKFG